MRPTLSSHTNNALQIPHGGSSGFAIWNVSVGDMCGAGDSGVESEGASLVSGTMNGVYEVVPKRSNQMFSD